MRRLLVTGGAGFIGSNFMHYWARRHPSDRVVVLDALTYAGNPANLMPLNGQPNFRFIHGDIRDSALLDKLLVEEEIDTIMHFAAESHVDRSIAGPDVFVETNIVGTHCLLKAARRAWLDRPDAPAACRFHHVSTDEVYGSLTPGAAAFTESSPSRPNSPYAASKAASDHLVRSYYRTYGLPTVTSNCSNNFGPYQFPEKLIPLVLINALEGRTLPIYGDGRQVRDWLYVEDHCQGIELVLERGREGETYNLGGDGEHANIDVVRLLCRLVDSAFAAETALVGRFPACPAAHGKPTEGLIKFVADRPGHDRRYAMDITRAQTELGYTPAESLESGLRRTLTWYLQNEPWWRGVMNGNYREWMHMQYGM